MKSMTISTRIDEPTKVAFTQVCEEVGLSPSQAMQLFAKAVVNYGGIPFEIKVRKPNVLTQQVINDFDDNNTKDDTLHHATDFGDLLNDCGVDKQTKKSVLDKMSL